jgi:hypothetical protein
MKTRFTQFLFMTLVMLSFFLQANAQLKVHANGYLSLGTSLSPNSPVSLNYEGSPNYYMSYRGGKAGLYCNSTSDTKCANFTLTPPDTTLMNHAVRILVNTYTPASSQLDNGYGFVHIMTHGNPYVMRMEPSNDYYSIYNAPWVTDGFTSLPESWG